jgi:predicted metal-dependent hydrolase
MRDLASSAGEWREYRHDSGDVLGFRFVRSKRRTIALYVHRDGAVMVRAPMRTPFAEIHLFMHERWAWLQRQLERFREEPTPRKLVYQHGESILHLGEEVRLNVNAANRSRALLMDGELHLAVPEGAISDSSALAAVVEAWQRRQARQVFPLRLAGCHERMRELSLPYPELRIRKMRSRWGSCSRKAEITLNLELIRMPTECIDYVITHELCHLVEFNHSPRFYELQAHFLPDWKERRRQLEDMARH